MIFLFKIGFLDINLLDLLDVIIVGYLIYRIYKLLRGSIAFNIFAGVAIIYAIWGLVSLLKMDMLSSILGQFVNVGFIIIIIIFQPEVRRFLLLLGNTTFGSRTSFFSRWLTRNLENREERQSWLQEIKSALLRMSREKTGALIVFSRNLDVDAIGHSSILLDANIHQLLLVSIFQKESPLHDGAVIIGKGKILAAGCILPVSESSMLPGSAGLRHRAGLGITERTNTATFIVSEETGAISYAEEGLIEFALTEARLNELLFKQIP
jgi:uncharacterized protein (TIGR00159 family)